MNSNEIYDALEFINSDPSSNAKIEYLKEFLEDDEFREIVQLTYNPFVTFGLKNINLMGCTFGSVGFGNSTYRILEQLRSRELSGNEARNTVWAELNGMTEKSVELFKRIINGNLEAGFHSKTVNKARKGTLPEICYMRCSLPSAVEIKSWNWEGGIYSQLKADGLFVNLTVTLGNVTMHTRKGQPLPMDKFEAIYNFASNYMPSNKQYHGELLVKRDGKFLSRKEGNGILNSIRLGGEWGEGEEPHVTLWDVIRLSDLRKKKSMDEYLDRLVDIRWSNNISFPPPVSVINYRIVYSEEEAKEHYLEMRALGLEGTILKKPEGFWKDGTSKDQVKFKDEKVCDLMVMSMNEGTGKNSDTFGSLLCMSDCSHLVLSVSGFTDEKRKEIFDNWDAWQHSIIHVRYNELIQDARDKYSLFLPRFDGEAFDKLRADDLVRIRQENV